MKEKLLLGLAVLVLLSGSAFATEQEQIIWTQDSLKTSQTVITYTDTEELSNQDQNVLQVLYALDIMQGDGDGRFRSNDRITRAEMAKILAAVQSLSEMEFAESGFQDVPQTHWAKNVIALVSGQGLMIGDEDGHFAPERNLSGAELSKVVAVLLGYTPMAEATGGYPDGYRNAVKKYVTKDKDLLLPNADTLVTRLETARLIYKALQAPLMEQTTFGSPENAEYAILDGSLGTDYVNLLNRNFLITCN